MSRIFLDATRLFVRGSRFSPTGIDRVVMAYSRSLLGSGDITLRPVLSVGGRILEVPRSLLAGIVEHADAFSSQSRGDDPPDRTWKSLTRALNSNPGEAPALRARSLAGQLPARARWHASSVARSFWRLRLVAFEPADVYLNVSHTGLDHPNVLGAVGRSGGRSVVMIHDLIPITHPEYCSPTAQARHVRRIDNVLRQAPSVITNSVATSLELADYARKADLASPAVQVAPLGVEADFLSPPPPLAAQRPYFVCVGTLEARKNLAFLLALWRRLADRLGSATPGLVLVGRRGWENESVIDQLQRSQAVARYVHEVSDLSDAQLARLIGGARALLAPSFAEGYDLPVVEAMAIGAPVIASSIPAHRELAPGAVLLDPMDGPAWLEAIEAASTATKRGEPRTGPSWSDHFAIVAPLLT